MTEGIIQKVFAKYYTNGFEVTIDDNDVMVIPSSHLEDAFKELIAEIEKGLIGLEPDMEITDKESGKGKVWLRYTDILELIIGDN